MVMEKYKLTLYVPRDLLDEVKIRAIRERRSVSKIAEQLFRQYLKGAKTKPKVSSTGKG